MSDPTNETGSLLTSSVPEGSVTPDQPGTNPTPSTPSESLNDLLVSIKNENGEPKYKDVETALKSLAHSQTFIQQLQNESREKEQALTQLQNDLKERTTVEDFVNQLTTPQDKTEATPSEQPSEAKAGLTVEDIEAYLVQREKTQTSQTNIGKVKEALTKSFGEQADSKLQAKAQELGMSIESIQRLSQDSPQAAITLLGLNTQGSTKPDASGTVNSSAFTSSPEPREVQKTAPSMLNGASTKQSIDYIRALRSEVEAKLK